MIYRRLLRLFTSLYLSSLRLTRQLVMSKPPKTLRTLLHPTPEQVWGVYLGQRRAPNRPGHWPGHPFGADPHGAIPELWATDRRARSFRCLWHMPCDCVPLDGLAGSEWLDLEPCPRCLNCTSCWEYREQFRRSFLVDAIDELRDCERDWRRFFTRYLKIRSPAEGSEMAPDIVGYERQGALIDVALSGLIPSMPPLEVDGLLVLAHVLWKSRQIGGSEVVVGFAAFMHALFRAIAVVRCFSRTAPDAKAWLEQIQDYMWACLPDWMRPPRNPAGKGRRSEKALYLGWYDGHRLAGQRSVIESHSGTGRGGPATLLVFDEVSTMKDFFARHQSAGPATSRTGGKKIMVSTPDIPGLAKYPKPAAEFKRLCIEMGGAEVMQERLDALKVETCMEKPPIPAGMFDVYGHAPGWSGHYATWREFSWGTEEWYATQEREYGDRTPIEFSWEPMQGFGDDDEGMPPCVEPNFLDEQERLNADERAEPLAVGCLIPEKFAHRACQRDMIRGGFGFVDGDVAARANLFDHLCGLPNLETENRDRWEIGQMRLELQQDLTGIQLYRMPEKDEAFWVIVDPSDGGHDGDKAAICWWSIDRQTTLAMWDGRLYQEHIGDLVQVGSKWLHGGNPRMSEVIFDTTGHSPPAIAARAVERSGERVFYRKNRGVVGKSPEARRATIGFLFTVDTKPEAVEALNSLLLNGNTRILDQETIDQLRKLRWKTVMRGGKPKRIVWTEGATAAERADDRADTILTAAAMTVSGEHYRQGVKPGQSLMDAAEKQERYRSRITSSKRSPTGDGRIRVV